MTDSAAARPTIYRGASPAALHLIASRALLDVVAQIRAYEDDAPWRDYAGYDVLRGACGLPDQEAFELTRATAMRALETTIARLEAAADADFERAVRTLGMKLRSARIDALHVQHHTRHAVDKTGQRKRGAA